MTTTVLTSRDIFELMMPNNNYDLFCKMLKQGGYEIKQVTAPVIKEKVFTETDAC